MPVRTPSSVPYLVLSALFRPCLLPLLNLLVGAPRSYRSGLNLGPVTAPKNRPTQTPRGQPIRYYKVQSEDNGQTHILPETSIRPWDLTHDSGEVLDDVTRINAFSEAPLLAAIQRRFLDLQIYTYVGDIVISVNPCVSFSFFLFFGFVFGGTFVFCGVPRECAQLCVAMRLPSSVTD